MDYILLSHINRKTSQPFLTEMKPESGDRLVEPWLSMSQSLLTSLVLGLEAEAE